MSLELNLPKLDFEQSRARMNISIKNNRPTSNIINTFHHYKNRDKSEEYMHEVFKKPLFSPPSTSRNYESPKANYSPPNYSNQSVKGESSLLIHSPSSVGLKPMDKIEPKTRQILQSRSEKKKENLPFSIISNTTTYSPMNTVSPPRSPAMKLYSPNNTQSIGQSPNIPSSNISKNITSNNTLNVTSNISKNITSPLNTQNIASPNTCRNITSPLNTQNIASPNTCRNIVSSTMKFSPNSTQNIQSQNLQSPYNTHNISSPLNTQIPPYHTQTLSKSVISPVLSQHTPSPSHNRSLSYRVSPSRNRTPSVHHIQPPIQSHQSFYQPNHIIPNVFNNPQLTPFVTPPAIHHSYQPILPNGKQQESEKPDKDLYISKLENQISRLTAINEDYAQYIDKINTYVTSIQTYLKNFD